MGWWPAKAVTFVDNHDTGANAFPSCARPCRACALPQHRACLDDDAGRRGCLGRPPAGPSHALSCFSFLRRAGPSRGLLARTRAVRVVGLLV
jgi:hypothetical protein